MPDMAATAVMAVTPRVTVAIAKLLTTAKVVVGPVIVVAAAIGAIAIVATVADVSSVAVAIAIVAMVAMVVMMPLPKPTLLRLPSLLIRLSRASSGLRLVSVRFTSADRIAERYDKTGPNSTMSLAVG